MAAWGTLASALLAGGGLLGDYFSKNDDKVSDDLLKNLQLQSEYGTGVGKLAGPGLGGVNAAYQNANTANVNNMARQGLSGTSMMNTANADLSERRAGSIGDVYADATAQNEQSKERAKSMLMSMLGMRDQQSASGAFGQLTGAGINGLLRGLYGGGQSDAYNAYNNNSIGNDSPFSQQNAPGMGYQNPWSWGGK